MESITVSLFLPQVMIGPSVFSLAKPNEEHGGRGWPVEHSSAERGPLRKAGWLASKGSLGVTVNLAETPWVRFSRTGFKV